MTNTAAPPHNRLRVRASVGVLPLDVDLPFRAPWTVLFGPSGSGKSSLLRAMCGLLSEGEVEFSRTEGVTNRLNARSDIPPARTRLESTAEGIYTAVSARRLGYAPQGGSLFPHKSVAENIRFPFTVHSSRGRNTQADPGGNTAPPTVEELLELFNLRALASRRPGALSGGERQRVNLARAFAVPGPRLMLLDEPFTGVDRATRDHLLPRMQLWLLDRGIPVISVTHDVEEALMLRAEVSRIENGRIIAQGPASEVLAAERWRMLQTLGASAQPISGPPPA